MAPLEIVTAGWYNLLYTLAVAAAGWAMFEAGRRRGWNTGSWAVAVATWLAAGMIGAMMPHLIFGDAVAPRTSIGAILFATLVLSLASRWVRRSTPQILDTTAVAIPLGAAIVRIGCFLAECCQGIATSLPVGIALHSGDESRHPAQLYEAALEALLALTIARRETWTRPGARFSASITAMCAIRFATEFVRDNEKFGGLSLAQWVVMPVGALCLMLLLARTGVARPRRTLTMTAQRSVIAAAGTLAMATIVFEMRALEASVLILGTALLIAAATRRVTRAAPAGLSVLLLQMPPISADTTYPRGYLSIGGGLNVTSWDALHRYANCEGTEAEEWKRRHTSTGATLELGMRGQYTPTSGFGLRARAHHANEDVGRAEVVQGTPANPQGYSRRSSGVSLVADRDWKNFGLSIGVNGGRFYPMLDEEVGPGDPQKPILVFPAIGLRVGRLHGISAEMRIADEAPMWSPAPVASIALALGDSRGNRVRVGMTEVGSFLSARHITRNGFEIVPSAILGRGGANEAEVQNLIHGAVMFRKWIRVAPRSPAGQ